MKGLFIGLGSVGQRHLRNAKSLLGDEGRYLAYRSTRTRLVIENGQADEVESLGDRLGVSEYWALKEALAEKPDYAVISNPSSMHADGLAACLEAGLYCLVEKPVVSVMEQVERFDAFGDSLSKRVMVGYQFRMHPAYRRLKDLIEAGSLGKIQGARFHWGTYLPEHHPYEDYRESYAARADLGGGALNGLSHDIDLMLDLLGPVEVLEAKAMAPSRLEMDGVEEAAWARLKSREGAEISLYLSYGDRPEAHWIELIGEKGRARCNLEKWSIAWEDLSWNRLGREAFPVDRNELFVSELQLFYKCVREGGIPACDFQQGVECIRIADAIRSCF